MSTEKFLSKLPQVIGWIDDTLAAHAAQARPVANFGFRRLPAFYPQQLLAAAKVVVLDQIPMPPLAEFGLPEFASFAQGQYGGITFKDTYFVKVTEASWEPLHFHELVHVVQWAHLGVEKFLMAYATGWQQMATRTVRWK